MPCVQTVKNPSLKTGLRQLILTINLVGIFCFSLSTTYNNLTNYLPYKFVC